MAGIAPLKAHLVKTTYNERSQPSKTWKYTSPEVLVIRHTGDSAVTTVTMGSYTLFLDFYALLLLLQEIKAWGIQHTY